MNKSSFAIGFTLLSLLTVLTPYSPMAAAEIQHPSWQETVSTSKGKTVDWYMWGGSPAVNKYVNGYLADSLKKQYDITLRQVPVKDIAEVVSKLVVEKEAGKIVIGASDIERARLTDGEEVIVEKII